MCTYQRFAFVLLLWLLPAFSLRAQMPATELPVRIMTYNIRLNVASDGLNAWPNRKDWVAQLVQWHSPDLLGVQEALPDQMEDLRRLLPAYRSLGVARDTVLSRAEYSAIFYRPDRLTCLESGTFWLSTTPEKISVGWDAALPRIVTWGKFRDNVSGKVFFHFNTHFDHVGKEARINSAHLIREKIAALNPEQLPAIVTGDFNAEPKDPPILAMLDSKTQPLLFDAWNTAITPPYGPNATWSGFKVAGEDQRRIDYVFVNKGPVVLRLEVITDAHGPLFPSDHLPVLAEVLIDAKAMLPEAFAHNDYAHTRPLFDALDHGFAAAEADIWLLSGELWVNHDRPLTLSPERSLEKLYLQPLAARIRRLGGVYPGADRPFLFMIDLKNEGEGTYQRLKEVFDPYAWMFLPEANGKPAVTVFLSGNRPMETMLADSNSYFGIDGRPEDLGKGYPAARMPVVSCPYAQVLKWKGKGPIPESEMKALQTLARAAHAEGKRVRFWATPEDTAVWQVLLDAGIDFINTDNLDLGADFLQKK